MFTNILVIILIYLPGLHPILIFTQPMQKWFEWGNAFTYIYSFLPGQTDSLQNIPFTPASRLTLEVKFEPSDKSSILSPKILGEQVA